MAKSKSRESVYFRDRRRRREQILKRVGIGTPQGQRLLDRWWAQDRASMVGYREARHQ